MRPQFPLSQQLISWHQQQVNTTHQAVREAEEESAGVKAAVWADVCADQSKRRVPSIHQVAMVMAGVGVEEC